MQRDSSNPNTRWNTLEHVNDRGKKKNQYNAIFERRICETNRERTKRAFRAEERFRIIYKRPIPAMEINSHLFLSQSANAAYTVHI